MPETAGGGGRPMDQADVQAVIDRLGGVEALLEGREEFHEAVLRMNRSGRRSWVAFPSLSGFLATAQFLLQFSYPGFCGVRSVGRARNSRGWGVPLNANAWRSL